ncbi:MAG: hypothetical protein ICV83_00985 [Cytophagales bacterium]|nr:hypothetical protein [Cytophagales bacterium]
MKNKLYFEAARGKTALIVLVLIQLSLRAQAQWLGGTTTAHESIWRYGRVAVGSPSGDEWPATWMHVKKGGDPANTVSLRVDGRIMSNDHDGGMFLSYDHSGFVGNYGNNIGFYTSSVGWDAFQIKKSNGFVGIGTTNPAAGLDVRTGQGKILANGLHFWASGFAADGQANARLAEGWGARFEGTDERWVLSSATSVLVGYKPVGENWGSGNLRVSGNVGIGTTNPGNYKLAVEGMIGARSVKVTSTTPFPDYVFYRDYKLRPLGEVETYVKQNQHLPDVPSAAEVEREGINLGEMDAVLLRKIEELTLYLIEQNKQLDQLRQENARQTVQINQLQGEKR